MTDGAHEDEDVFMHRRQNLRRDWSRQDARSGRTSLPLSFSFCTFAAEKEVTVRAIKHEVNQFSAEVELSHSLQMKYTDDVL